MSLCYELLMPVFRVDGTYNVCWIKNSLLIDSVIALSLQYPLISTIILRKFVSLKGRWGASEPYNRTRLCPWTTLGACVYLLLPRKKNLATPLVKTAIFWINYLFGILLIN